MKNYEKFLSILLLTFLVLSVLLLIIILFKYYTLININEIYHYIISNCNSNFNPENLLSISIALNTGFGALILIFFGLVIPKSNLTLKAFIKYFLLTHIERTIALISIPLVIVLALFLSNFNSYKGIQLSFQFLIPIPIISYIILFISLFEIENLKSLNHIIVSYLHNVIVKENVDKAAFVYREITCEFSLQTKTLILHDVIELLSRDKNKHKEQMEFFEKTYGMINSNEYE